MSSIAMLSNIETSGLSSALEKLTGLAQDYVQTNGETVPPILTLFMKSGVALQGYVINVTPGPERRTVLFAVINSAEGASLELKDLEDLSYIFLDEVASITVHQAINIIDLISEGKISRSLGQAPSIGQIENELNQLIENINGLMETQIAADIGELPDPINNEVLHALKATVQDLAYVLKKISLSEISTQALQNNPIRFKITVDDEARVEFNKRQCIVHLGFNGTRALRVSRESLFNNIEELI